MVARKLSVLCTKYIVTSQSNPNIFWRNFRSCNWPEFALHEKIRWGTKKWLLVDWACRWWRRSHIIGIFLITECHHQVP